MVAPYHLDPVSLTSEAIHQLRSTMKENIPKVPGIMPIYIIFSPFAAVETVTLPGDCIVVSTAEMPSIVSKLTAKCRIPGRE